MTTPVIVTTYIQSIEFDFDMNGAVLAILANSKTAIQDPGTMQVIASHTTRENMLIDQAKQIIANSQMNQ